MNDSNHLIIADGHVHIHECFDIKKFFETAWTNFFAESNKLGIESFTGVLFLTESLNANWFLRFLQSAGEKSKLGDLRFERTKENVSLKAKFEDEKELLLIAGRQIVSKENLEVLALGIEGHFGEGESVSEIIRETISRGGVPVIPWGVGKWFGKRGSLVNELMQNGANFFLGDNSGRPAFWQDPSHFKKAVEKEIPILPGSDPLPFPSEYKKVGSFGFMLRHEIDQNFPAKSLAALLKESDIEIRTYGKLENPARFVFNQFRMRV